LEPHPKGGEGSRCESNRPSASRLRRIQSPSVVELPRDPQGVARRGTDVDKDVVWLERERLADPHAAVGKHRVGVPQLRLFSGHRQETLELWLCERSDVLRPATPGGERQPNLLPEPVRRVVPEQPVAPGRAAQRPEGRDDDAKGVVPEPRLALRYEER